MRKLVFVLLLCSVLFSVPAYAEEGLVAHYSFDENAGNIAHDLSGNGNDGAIYGATWTDGVNGSALSFDGVDDWIEINNSLLLNSITELTVEAWIKTNEINPLKHQIIINQGQSWDISIGPDGYLISDGIDTTMSDIINTTYPIEAHKWYYIAITYDGLIAKIYKNGVEAVNTSLGSPLAKDTMSLMIGANSPDPLSLGPNGLPYIFNGKIDEVKIYNRALSEEEIMAEYEMLAPENGLVAEYHFDGNTQDSSGNGNDGTNHGATYVSGINNNALSFDGATDYVQIQDSNSLEPEQVSIELWIKPNIDLNSSIGVPGVPILTKTNGQRGGVADGYEIQYENGRLYFGLAEKYSWRVNLAVETNLQAGNWYHIAGTYDEQTMKLYLNGQLIGSITESFPVYYGSDDIWIGKFYMWGDNYFFNGLIDEVKIYNRALTPEEIEQEYERYTAPTDSDGDGLPDSEEIKFELNPYSNDTDSDGINDYVEHNLTRTYMPVFYFFPETARFGNGFYPAPVQAMLNYSTLYGPGTEKENLTVYDISNYTTHDYYMDFKEWHRYDANQNNHKQSYDDIKDDFGYTVYSRVVNNEYNGTNYVVVQYWLFYLYNDFWNNHEGDWELVEVILNDTTMAPAYASYSQHEWAEVKNWSDVEKEQAQPRVYVAMGSHGNYFSSGMQGTLLTANVSFRKLKARLELFYDFTSSNGLVLNETNNSILGEKENHLSVQSWLDYGGHWGDKKRGNHLLNLGLSGPTGPAYQTAKWQYPAGWSFQYLENPHKPLIRFKIAMLFSPAHLLITDESDRSIGYFNGTFINEIPGATILSYDEELYLLPENLTYSMEITGYDNGTYDFIFADINESMNKIWYFENVTVSNESHDEIQFSDNSAWFHTDDNEKNMTLTVIAEERNESVNETFTGVSTGNKETVEVTVSNWSSLDAELAHKLIDTEPPEALVYFNMTSKGIAVEGTDNEDESVDVYYESKCIDRKCKREIRTYYLLDDSGNNMTLNIEYSEKGKHKKRMKRAVFKMKLINISYNDSVFYKLPKNKFRIEFSPHGKDEDKFKLVQKLEIKHNATISARYNSKKNETTIKISSHKKRMNKDKATYKGMKRIALLTKEGQLDYQII